MRSRISGRIVVAICIVAAVVGCGSKMRPTNFTNPKFNFAYVERVAVVPFENLTQDRQAGFRVTRLMATELLASGAVEVVESGEVEAALARIQGADYGRIAVLSTEQVVSIGQALRVQAVILGTVTQADVTRSGAISIPVVTLDARMVETETGTTVWAATHTEKGGSAGARALGSGGQSVSVTTRKCVQVLIKTMVE